MSELRAFTWRLFSTLRRRQQDDDLDEEIRSHLDMQIEEHVRRGMTPGEARAAALRQFGRIEHMKEDYRDLRSLPFVDSLVRDVRYSLRLLRRAPGFAAIAILTLAVGIGSTTAVFSIVNRALLAPLPIERPEQIVSVNHLGAGFPTFSYPHYLDLRDRSRVFAALMAYRFTPLSVRAEGVNERLWGYMVSGNYFEALGVGTAIGRPITTVDDGERGAHPVVVISYRFWQQRFGGDAAAIGRGVLVNGRTYTVVGVAPRGFYGTEVAAAPDLWFPMAMQAALELGNSWLDDRRVDNLFIMGRLRPDVTRARAAAELEGVAAGIAREHPDVTEGRRVSMSPPGLFGSAMRAPVIGFTTLLLVIAALVLLVACSNLANLLLARAIDRRREIAVRLSLGAGRLPLVRQLLIESLMLSAAAGALGLLLAVWLTRAVVGIRIPIDIPFGFDLPLDGRVLAFNLALSLVTAVAFGLLPALQATKANLIGVLKDATATTEWRGVSWRNALIVVQVALSLVLLTGAGLMWRALSQANDMPLGFNIDRAVEVSFDLRLQGYSPGQGREMQQRFVEQVRTLPGITDAALADVIPIDLHYSRARVYAEGTPVERDAKAPASYFSSVSPGYFRTMRTRLVEGRDFTDLDTPDSTRVAIVNRAFARTLWPGGTAIGRRFRMGDRPDAALAEVVGIVEDGKYGSFGDESRPAFFRPLQQAYSGSITVVARTTADVGATIGLVRGAVRELDPNMPIASARTLEERLAVPLLPARVTAWALGIFGMLALVLAAVGLYGVMSYSVSSRTREIGVRMALGAQHGDLLRMVIGEGSRLIVIGIVAGGAVALLVTRLMRALLFGVSPTDPTTYAVVAAAMFGVALIACWIPARRALRTNPLEALRAS
jgi:macrolide transport system ATP-binding/permease protein